MDNKVSLIMEIIQSEIFTKDLLIFEHGLGRLVFILRLMNVPNQRKLGQMNKYCRWWGLNYESLS
jgi:hypothetical protein